MPGLSFSAYFALSSSLTALAVSYAFQSRVQFYPAVIYLVTSKPSVLVLGNMGVMLTLLAGRVMKKVFFGQLRDVEVELLYDNARYAVTETCLALTIFREELTVRVLTLFTALLFSKSFHWLCQSRVEYVESDNVSRWTHVRLLTLMCTLLVWDVAFVAGCVYFWNGPSVLILFGFEYTILAVSVTSTLLRYCLHLVDMRIEGNWPQKGSYLFFLEFATEVVRFLSYVVFFSIIFTYYGMPLHIVRDLWMSYVNLKRRLVIFNKYRHLTANMNERFPDATPEELVACEHTCIICRDLMEAGPGAKKLPCAHIFHLDCLRLWLQQQQSCPTCRADIPTTATPPANPPAAAAAPVPAAPGVPGAAAAGAAAAAAAATAAVAAATGAAAQGGGGGGVAQQGVEDAEPNAGQPPAAGHEQQPPRANSSGRLGAFRRRQINPMRTARYAGGAPGAAAGAAALPANFPHPPTTATGPAFPPHPSFPHPPTTPVIAGMGGGGMPPPSFPTPYTGFNAFLPPGAGAGAPSPFFYPFPTAPFGMGPAGARGAGGDLSAMLGGQDFPERPFVLYRVVSPLGAMVRASMDLASQVVRTHRQHEMVIILERTADSANGFIYRVLGGGYIHEQPPALILEAMPSPPPMPFGMPGAPLSFLPPLFLPPAGPSSSSSSSSSSSAASSASIGGAGGLSRSLVSLRLDLNEAKASVETVVEGLAVLLARQQVEAQRLQNVLARMEQAHEELATQAAAAASGGGLGRETGAGGGGGVEEAKEGEVKRQDSQAPSTVRSG